MRVISGVLSEHRLSPKDLPESCFYALGFIAISLKEKGLSKKQAVDAIMALCHKHGGLLAALSVYSEIMGIPKTREEELLDTFMSVTGSIADSLGAGGNGAEQIRMAAVESRRIARKQELMEKARRPIEPSVPSYYRLASFIAKDNSVTEEVIIDMIKDEKIAGKFVEGYWRVDTRIPMNARVIRCYLAEHDKPKKKSSDRILVDTRASDAADKLVSEKELSDALEGVKDELSREDELLKRFFEEVEREAGALESLSAQQVEVVRSIVVAIMERGMSEESTLNTLLKLVQKYGTIVRLIDRYSNSGGQSDH